MINLPTQKSQLSLKTNLSIKIQTESPSITTKKENPLIKNLQDHSIITTESLSKELIGNPLTEIIENRLIKMTNDLFREIKENHSRKMTESLLTEIKENPLGEMTENPLIEMIKNLSIKMVESHSTEETKNHISLESSPTENSTIKNKIEISNTNKRNSKKIINKMKKIKSILKKIKSKKKGKKEKSRR